MKNHISLDKFGYQKHNFADISLIYGFQSWIRVRLGRGRGKENFGGNVMDTGGRMSRKTSSKLSDVTICKIEEVKGEEKETGSRNLDFLTTFKKTIMPFRF